MSRSISQIYAEAVVKRNDYLQLTSLNSGRSEAKMSVINVLTYIMAVLIYSYESLLDVFQVQISNIISKRINGTARYYAEVALYFQYNPDSKTMDDMVFDETTFQFKFKTVDTTRRIVSKSAFEEDQKNGTVIKICKNNSNTDNSDGGAKYMPLSDYEMLAFNNYMDEIKFLGAKLSYRSVLGDLMTVKATIVYDDLYIDAEQAFENVKAALVAYEQNLDFNGLVYYQSVIDAIQGAAHIVTVSGIDSTSSDGKYAKVMLQSYDTDKKAYGDPSEVVERRTPYSGYLTFVDETNSNQSTLSAGDNLVFKAKSTLS